MPFGRKTLTQLAKPGSLRRFVACAAFLSIVVPAVVCGVIVIQQNRIKTITQDSIITANKYADLLQGGLKVALWNISPELGKPLIESVSIDRSIVLIDVRDEIGTSFLRYQNSDYVPKSNGGNDDNIVLIRKITYQDQILGEVEAHYSLQAAHESARRESKSLIIIIVVQLVISLSVLSIVLNKRVFKPLGELRECARRIAKGDLKTEVPPLQRDEFGELSQQLETMRSSLESHVNHLEKRVVDRTSELSVLNLDLMDAMEQLQKAQTNLVQSEKLAALGALVAGVAHELNTPLGNGLTVATSLRVSTNDLVSAVENGMTRSMFDEYLSDMQEGTMLVEKNLEKASELVKSFKQTAVDQTSAKRRNFELFTLINEIITTLSPTLKKTPYQVDIQAGDEVRLDSFPGPLGQVISNLVNNAIIHAFERRETGKICISYKMVGSDKVKISVADNGVGISDTNLKKIFDPFFTTKLGEGGNGLGMHIVHNIVTGVLNGAIDVESVVNCGTTFHIEIPLVAPECEAKQAIAS